MNPISASVPGLDSVSDHQQNPLQSSGTHSIRSSVQLPGGLHKTSSATSLGTHSAGANFLVPDVPLPAMQQHIAQVLQREVSQMESRLTQEMALALQQQKAELLTHIDRKMQELLQTIQMSMSSGK